LWIGSISQSGPQINTCGKLPYRTAIKDRPAPKAKNQTPLTTALSKEVINEAPSFCFIMKVQAEKTYDNTNTVRIALTINEVFIFNTPCLKNMSV
jgi:hypothetical protein